MQECRTAVDCVQEACKDAGITCSVETERLDDYPITVEVINSTGDVLWSNDQRRLFRKYGEWRT